MQTRVLAIIWHSFFLLDVMDDDIDKSIRCKQNRRIWSISGLTHWGRVTHICVSKFTIIALDDGLSPGRRQAIIWNNGGILSIGLLGTNFSEILIEILTFSFKKMRLKMSSAKWRLLRLGLNELKQCCRQKVEFSPMSSFSLLPGNVTL